MAVTRTIYLATDQDLKLYNKGKRVAEQIGKSVSNYILEALEHYMNNDSNKVELPLYILYIGESPQIEKKKFYGIYLTSEIKQIGHEEIETQVYLTKKGNIMIYKRTRNLDTSYENADYQVYQSLDQIENISESLYEMAKIKLDIKEAELLDV